MEFLRSVKRGSAIFVVLSREGRELPGVRNPPKAATSIPIIFFGIDPV